MIKKVILGLLTLIVSVVIIFCIVAAMQPADFKITRSATFNAQPERIFEQINNLHNWEAWSPWDKIDPEMKKTYSGPDSGPGATYAWSGNKEVGEGKMTIAESHPSQHIKVDLDFIAPFAVKNVSEFVLKPEGGQTTVTWSMTGKRNFILKAFSLLIDMDKHVGGDFEKGLTQLKPVVESAPTTGTK